MQEQHKTTRRGVAGKIEVEEEEEEIQEEEETKEGEM